MMRQTGSRRLLAQGVHGLPAFVVMLNDVNHQVAWLRRRKALVAKGARKLPAGAGVVRLFNDEVWLARWGGLNDHGCTTRTKS